MDDDEETAEESDDPPMVPAKRAKIRHEVVADVAHCDINFVANTQYALLADDTNKVWGTAIIYHTHLSYKKHNIPLPFSLSFRIPTICLFLG